MDDSTSSCSPSGDHLSQSLPTMEALDLNNSTGCHGDVVGNKQPRMTSTNVSNKLIVSNCDDKSATSSTAGVPGKFTNANSGSDLASGKLTKVSRNGKDVMLPGNQETPVAVDEAQKLLDMASLPYVDDDGTHHRDGGKHRASSKKAGRKMSRDKDVNHPVRVTRSTSKLMAAQVSAAPGNDRASDNQSYHSGQDVDSVRVTRSTSKLMATQVSAAPGNGRASDKPSYHNGQDVDGLRVTRSTSKVMAAQISVGGNGKVFHHNRQDVDSLRVTRSTRKLITAQVTGNGKASDKQSHHNGQDVDSLPADDVKCNANTNNDQIKYNKSRGFHAPGKAANCTRSEINSVFTNNGTKQDGHHCSKVNSDVNVGSHVVDHILNDSLIPLQDVTNSSSNSDATAAATTARPHAQARAYDLIAGKKSKKGKRQQSRKAAHVPHKKTLNMLEDANSPTAEEPSEPVNDNKSAAHVKDTIGLPHSEASGHTRNSRELDMPTMAATVTFKPNLMCDMFSVPHVTMSNGSVRMFKSNDYESESNFHTLFQDHSDIFL